MKTNRPQFIKIGDRIININSLTDVSRDLTTGGWLLSYRTVDVPRGNIGFISVGHDLPIPLLEVLKEYGIREVNIDD